MLNNLDFSKAKRVLEIGGLHAPFTHSLQNLCGKRKADFCIVPAHAAPDSYLLDFADASFDIIAIRHLIETLRMDQLYMIFSEARRILRPGGELLIANTTFSDAAWKKFWATKLLGKRLLRMNHYFSPEDWKEKSWYLEPGSFTPVEILVLERL